MSLALTLLRFEKDAMIVDGLQLRYYILKTDYYFCFIPPSC